MSDQNNPPTFFDWLGLNDPRSYPKVFGHFVGFFLTLVLLAFVVLFVMAFAAAFVLVFDAFTGTASLGLGALLVALLGAPFLIWRTIVAQNTLDTARKEAKLKEEALFNDKINAAAKDLAARRQVTRVVAQDGKETILTEWEDDLVTRAAAIDQLEGLAIDAIDRGDYPPAQRIARMLSIYVQELSREYPAKPAPDYMDRRQIRDWAKGLKPARPDMERAVQALGKINPEDDRKRAAFNPRHIDLRYCNLQGFDLRFVNFAGVSLGNANMEGMILLKASMTGAVLIQAKLQSALLKDVDLKKASLKHADLRGTTLHEVQLQGTDLNKARLQGAFLSNTKFSSDTNTFQTVFSGSAMQHLDNPNVMPPMCFWDSIFADGTVLKGNENRSEHWHEDYLEAGKSNYVVPSSEFADRWRAWAATLTPPVTIAPDYRDKDPI